jgi:predicted metal-dependent hydrolase
MHKVSYGQKEIEFYITVNNSLKSHYISVSKAEGVELKGPEIELEKAKQLILKKAQWILAKSKLVEAAKTHLIVTGSRMPYLGKSYYVKLEIDNSLSKIEINFTYSKFLIRLPESKDNQEDLLAAFEDFYRAKAIEKIPPRIKKWVDKTGLKFNELKFQKLEKRWGSCTASNNIIINIDAIKLSYSLIDYLLVHELVHTKIKNHSQEFWAALSHIMPNWKALDEKMGDYKF